MSRFQQKIMRHEKKQKFHSQAKKEIDKILHETDID